MGEPMDVDLKMDTDQLLVILEGMSKYLSFEELKRCRLVCTNWDIKIKAHPRFLNSKVILDSSIYLNDKNTVVDLIRPRCTNAKIQGLNLGRNLFMKDLWRPHYQPIVRKLEINQSWVWCLTLCKVINNLPHLEELVLSHIRFKRNVDKNTAALAQNNQVPLPQNVICLHGRIPPEVVIPTNRVNETIRKIAFVDVPVIPICLLELLRVRCRSVLQEFQYSDVSMGTRQRETFAPILVNQHNQFIRLIFESIGMLRKIVWKNNGTGNEFVSVMTQSLLADLSLRELALSQPKNLTLGLPVQSGPIVLDFIQKPRFCHAVTGLTKLELGFVGRFSIQTLQNTISKMVTLESLVLKFDRFGEKTGLVINFQHLTRLHSIEIVQSTSDIVPFTLGVLPIALPDQLTSLVLDSLRSLNTETLTARLGGTEHRLLTKLMIGQLEGTNLGDTAMQLIIENLPCLEDLSVVDAGNVTDEGITGLPLSVVNSVIQNRSYGLIFGDVPFILPEGRRNLKELKYLRRLNLSGCWNVSDVSIGLAFHLPYLREIDLSYMNNVTDTGIMFLSKNNPGLEKLTLKHNNRISHFGLNQLVKHSPTISLITTSPSVYYREFKGVKYTDTFSLGSRSKVRLASGCK